MTAIEKLQQLVVDVPDDLPMVVGGPAGCTATCTYTGGCGTSLEV